MGTNDGRVKLLGAPGVEHTLVSASNSARAAATARRQRDAAAAAQLQAGALRNTSVSNGTDACSTVGLLFLPCRGGILRLDQVLMVALLLLGEAS